MIRNRETVRLNSKGMTLIELTVALVVVALIGAITLSFLTDKFVAQARVSGQAELQRQARLTLMVLARDIKHSAGADEQNRWEDAHGPDGPYSWEGNEEVLLLATPAQDSAGGIIFRDDFGYVSYKDNHIFFLDDGRLMKRTLAADISGNRASTTCPAGTPDCSRDILLAENVSDFQVEYVDGNAELGEPTAARSLNLTLTLNRDIFGHNLSGSYNIRAVFRNE